MNDDDFVDEAGSGDLENWAQDLESRVEDLESRAGDLERNSTNSLLAFSRAVWIDGAYLMGMMLAIALSWSRNLSILWCIVHGLLSWLYVMYFAWTR